MRFKTTTTTRHVLVTDDGREFELENEPYPYIDPHISAHPDEDGDREAEEAIRQGF